LQIVRFEQFAQGGTKKWSKKCVFLPIFAQKARTFANFLSLFANFCPFFTKFFLPILPKPYKLTYKTSFFAQKPT